MKVANIAELKNGLSKFIAAVEQGEEVIVQRRNVPVARLVPIRIRRALRNETQLGCGKGTVTIVGDLIEPLIREEDWDMLCSSDHEAPA